MGLSLERQPSEGHKSLPQDEIAQAAAAALAEAAINASPQIDLVNHVNNIYGNFCLLPEEKLSLLTQFVTRRTNLAIPYRQNNRLPYDRLSIYNQHKAHITTIVTSHLSEKEKTDALMNLVVTLRGNSEKALQESYVKNQWMGEVVRSRRNFGRPPTNIPR